MADGCTDPAYLDHIHRRGDWLKGMCTCRTRPDGTKFFLCPGAVESWANRPVHCTGEGQACGGYCPGCFRWHMDEPIPLTFQEFARVNRERCNRWHPGFPADKAWTGADWSNAMCGEAGETANIVKKIRRVETGTAPGPDDPPMERLIEMLADEIADTVTYADLLATYYGIDLAEAVTRKFNRISERQGFPDRLPQRRDVPRRSGGRRT